MKNPFKNLLRKSTTEIATLINKNDIVDARTKMSSAEALKYNQSSLYINKGFAKRAEKVGEINFLLKDEKGELIEDSEILDILDNPNRNYTGDKFWALATLYRDVTGMAVIRKIKTEDTKDEIFRDRIKYGELEILNSRYIEVVESTTETGITHFRYSDPNTKKVENIPYEECIYWHIPDPFSPLQPLPLVLAGLLSIESGLSMEQQYNSTIKNGGSIDGLFRFKEGITTEKVEQLKKDYARLLRDNKTENIPLILGGDASFERIALSPQELQTLEAKKMLIDDLIAVTGVPKSILGITSGETFANADTGYRIFLRETIKPIMRDLVNILNWKFVPDEYTLDFEDPTPEDVEQNLKKLQTGSQVNALTLNEKREMLGLDPVENGDEIDKPEPVQPPVEDDDEEEVKTLKKKSSFKHPLRDEEFRDKYYQAYLKSVESNSKKFEGQLMDFFEGQQKRVLEKISLLKGVQRKRIKLDVLDETLEINLMTPLLNTLKELARDEGQEVVDMFEPSRDYAYLSGVDQAINTRFQFFAKTVTNTTLSKLEKEFTSWFDSNEPVSDLITRVNGVYDFSDKEKYRAETIVNTEISTVTNIAKGSAYEQLGISTKIWVHRPGIKGGVRDDHASMDGEEVDFGKPFSNGLMHPHDPSAPGKETINCNCTW